MLFDKKDFAGAAKAQSDAIEGVQKLGKFLKPGSLDFKLGPMLTERAKAYRALGDKEKAAQDEDQVAKFKKK